MGGGKGGYVFRMGNIFVDSKLVKCVKENNGVTSQKKMETTGLIRKFVSPFGPAVRR